MNQLKIHPVNQTNWREVAALTVAPQQSHFIESNQQSLLEAAYDHSLMWRPLALFNGDIAVGFAMVGAYDAVKHSVWLDRFMLHYHFQGKVLGSSFLKLLTTFLFSEFPVSKILLSLHEENSNAAALYRQHGFQDSGRYDPENGERIYVLLRTDRY